MCGGAAVVGGAALVFTGGLAAPAVAAGFTALGSTAVIGGGAAALGSFLAGNALLVTSLFGVRGHHCQHIKPAEGWPVWSLLI